MKQGIKKGGVTDVDEAQISLGIAYLRKGQKDQARQAFKAVKADSQVERSGRAVGRSARSRPDAAPVLGASSSSEKPGCRRAFVLSASRSVQARVECTVSQTDRAARERFQRHPHRSGGRADATQRRQVPHAAGLHRDQGRHQGARRRRPADGGSQAAVAASADACRPQPSTPFEPPSRSIVSRRFAKKPSARTSASAGMPAPRR